MLVGVDQRGQLKRGLEAVVGAEPQLGEEGQIGAQAGQDDDLVQVLGAGAVLGDQGELAVGGPFDGGGAGAGERGGVAAFDGGLGGETEGSAGGELVGGADAEGGAGKAAAKHPHRVGAGFLVAVTSPLSAAGTVLLRLRRHSPGRRELRTHPSRLRRCLRRCVAGLGHALDGYRPDRADVIGALICLASVAVIMYALRTN
ncbi:hypothetical protein P3T37_004240 [Kitasatospora sp. MAA4]|nr:hypothetical protein [Kitasatospora sp. MAA4]